MGAFWRAVMDDASYEHYMRSTVHDCGLKPWFWLCFVVSLARLTRDVFMCHVVCRHRGHDFEDTGSWAGPESGGEDMTCRRCGFHFRHVYY